jgi:hypothetical protein
MQSLAATAKITTASSALKRWLYAVLILLFCFPLATATISLTWRHTGPVCDFTAYWGAARAFLAHQNPYAAEPLLTIQRSIGWSTADPIRAYNPPWTLPPLQLSSAFSPSIPPKLSGSPSPSQIELFSSLALWTYFGGSPRTRWIALLIPLSFLPLGDTNQLGQITPLIRWPRRLSPLCPRPALFPISCSPSASSRISSGCAVAIRWQCRSATTVSFLTVAAAMCSPVEPRFTTSAISMAARWIRPAESAAVSASSSAASTSGSSTLHEPPGTATPKGMELARTSPPPSSRLIPSSNSWSVDYVIALLSPWPRAEHRSPAVIAGWPLIHARLRFSHPRSVCSGSHSGCCPTEPSSVVRGEN